ncbi:transporter substrate-binding domain-containing protein [Wielerella bovis]|uniref:transporter substrate-binding domain-containing protein n=1 Tax=Wielerella bovis TaxID=2917790 RepID=UPI002019A478|nr:transporter substrate-binding domain-containing protein [Wielerella bovis]ULJ69212.1 transporter substrate-binding domain-containing protein [Wielerella bovis]
MKKWTLIALSILSLSACQDASNQNTSAASTPPTETGSEKVYRVAIEHEFSPFIIPGAGTTTGFEAELLQEIAKKQGFQVKFEPTLWEQVFPKLDSGESDIAGSGIIMTSDRVAKWDFSEPFIVAKYAAIASEESTISKSADVKSKRIAANKGTALENFAESLGAELVQANSVFLSIQETMKRNTEATMVNSVIADYYVAQYPDQKLKVIAFNDVELPIGFAVKKGNTELKQKINAGLTQVKSDGTYDRLKEKWHIHNH